MRFFQLYESTYEDILRDEVVEFIKSHENQYSNAVVTFSNSDTPNSTPLGIKVIPLMYFVNHPLQYQKILKNNQLLKLTVTSKILNISRIDRKIFSNLMLKLGITNIKETYAEVVSNSGYRNQAQSFGYVLNYVLQRDIIDGEVVDRQISNNTYVKRIIRLGYSGIVDHSLNLSVSIISDEYPSIGYLFENSSFNVDEVVGFDDVQVSLSRDEILLDIASKVAEGLNTGLNHDEPYHRGLDHYFWTYDGMQIRITETFGQRSKGNDGTAYILDIETPYGILYHVSEPVDSHDDIQRDVKARYERMNEPLANWRPIDRDVFLMNQNMEYKDYELKLEDIVKEVRKYYGEMRQFGLRYKIQLQPIDYYSEYDLSFMSGIMDRFAQNGTAMTFINKISNNEEITDLDLIDDYFPRQRLPRKMTFEELKRMALIYDIAKKLQPKKSGWRVFHQLR